MLNPDPDMAARLKAEGNALFQAKDYRGAYEKYTQAISYDSRNAILYCNRSACSLGLRRRLAAIDDAATVRNSELVPHGGGCDLTIGATQAVELDPAYAKAWARLGAACMGNIDYYSLTMGALNNAVAVLPPEGTSTPAVEKQRAEYKALIDAAEEQYAQIRQTSDAIYSSSPLLEQADVPEARMPWNLAAEVIPALRSTAQWNSSAWLIKAARAEWDAGMSILRELKHLPELDRYAGREGCVERLCNCVLMDTRAFAMTRIEAFDLFPKQVNLELAGRSCGRFDGDSRKVIAEASERMKTGDVALIRDTLSVTVGGWIISGYIQHDMLGASEHALDFLMNALEVMQWGVELWKDGSGGSLFSPVCARAAKSLHLQVLSNGYMGMESSGEQAELLALDEIGARAQDLIEESIPLPETPKELEEWEAALILALSRYPVAEAHAVRGCCFYLKGKIAMKAAGGLNEESSDLLFLASDAYLEAARIYPEDDELQLLCLSCGFSILLGSGTSPEIGTLLDITSRIADAAPKIAAIWEVALRNPRRKRNLILKKCAEWRAAHLAGIEAGTLTRKNRLAAHSAQPGAVLV